MVYPDSDYEGFLLERFLNGEGNNVITQNTHRILMDKDTLHTVSKGVPGSEPGM